MGSISEPGAPYSGDPQIEDGYTRIANELLEAVVHLALPGGHLRIMFALIRRTYGFNKKADMISYGQLAMATGLHRSHVIRALAELVAAKIVTKGTAGVCRPVAWGINKHYLEWQPTSSTDATSSTQANSTDATRTSSTEATRTSSTQATHKRHKDRKTVDAKMLTAQQAMVGALAEVWQVDVKTAPKGRLGKAASALLKAEYTPEQVEVVYAAGGWWYRQDWRGQRGDPPTPEQVGETIARAVKPRQLPQQPQLATRNADGTFNMPPSSRFQPTQ